MPEVIAIEFDRVWDTSILEIKYSDGSKRTVSVDEGDSWDDGFNIKEEPSDDV